MYKNAAISEILYCMSLQLKGGLRLKKIWNREFIEHLESILSIMELSAGLLETKHDITNDEVLPLINFVNGNLGRLFYIEKIDMSEFCDENSKLVLINNCDWDEDDEHIIAKMREIVDGCRQCLNDRQTGYKDEVQRLFHRYHNLPRAYLSRVYDPNVKTTFLGKDYSRWALSKSSALGYSEL